MTALPQEARELLRRPVHGHIITRNPDGTPQVTMVWMDVDGDRVIFNTAEGRQKVRNLRRDPHIVVSVQDNEQPHQYLRVEGIAELTTEGADEQIDRLANKYLGEERYPWRQPGEQRVQVRITPERIAGAGPWAG